MGKSKIWLPPLLNPLTDCHQNLCRWLRLGYLPPCKILSRLDKVFRFCACANSCTALNCFLGYFLVTRKEPAHCLRACVVVSPQIHCNLSSFLFFPLCWNILCTSCYVTGKRKPWRGILLFGVRVCVVNIFYKSYLKSWCCRDDWDWTVLLFYSNVLPPHLHSITETSAFEHHLKRFLFIDSLPAALRAAQAAGM